MRYSSICRSLAGDTGYVSAESSIESDDEKELNHILEPQHAGKWFYVMSQVLTKNLPMKIKNLEQNGNVCC